MKEVLKRNGTESERLMDRVGMNTGEKKENEREKERQRQSDTKRRSETKPAGEDAPSEFQVVLVALLSHLDLYCSCLGISQGLPDTAQGYCNSLVAGR